MRKKIFLFVFMTVGVLASFSQNEKAFGKWKVVPEPKDGIIGHLTLAKVGSEFWISRTKEPKDKWQLTFDKKNHDFQGNVDGKEVLISFNEKTDHLVIKDKVDGKILMDLVREK
ncbi:MAG: hypothetical protein ACXVNM_01945 [Bacteroidia bacterium]